MYKNTLTLVFEGNDIMFNFMNEAKEFAKKHNLKIEYDDGDMTDNEHYNVIGYDSKLYWIAR